MDIRKINEPIDILCIYHGNCSDGFTGAWAIKEWAKKHNHVIEYYSGKYGEGYPPINMRHVIIVDFSYDRETMIKMSRFSNTITVLDHHKTAEAAMKDLEEELQCPSKIIFDMEKSGALLAWEYFHNKEDIPMMLKHVSDRDLWNFEMEKTKEATSTIFSYDQTFENWDFIMNKDNYESLIETGSGLLRKQNKDVESLYNLSLQHKEIEVDGKLYKNVPVANISYIFASDIGHIMLDREPDAPFSLTYFINAEGEFSCSLRSRDDRIDVSEIAKYFGGGGHRNASGFKSCTQPWL